ncbi:MAG: isoamylase early set domain-containing protein [Anaerolineae bacterium]|jgi:1,4-alpha-glucan branching enzyme|nr:isoamylase early set domain-containing protein [Anaerolineae bacterium]
MLKKQHLKTKPVCKVTFYSPAQVEAETVHLVGDFNGWNETSDPMKQLKDGRFSLTLELEADKEYQFRYLVNGTEWHNDWEADKYAPNPFSGDNSVVTT